jgi:hypothetical protein
MPSSRAGRRSPSTFGALFLSDLDRPWTYSAKPATSPYGEVAIAPIVVPMYNRGNNSLLIGDAVFLDASSASGVDKSTTVANYANRVGIVCGGPGSDYRVVDDFNEVGVLQVTANPVAVTHQMILVAVGGVYWGIADETMAAGGLVGIGAATTTAGRLKTTAPAAGRIFGIKLNGDANVAGTAFPLLIALA